MFLIIQAECFSCSQPDLYAEIGDMGEMFLRAFPAHPHDMAVCNVSKGEKLPDSRRLSGAIITGSSAMVSDKIPWIDDVVRWTIDAISVRLPLLGVCFGHQLIAKALGGQVCVNTTGPEYGTIEVECTADSGTDPLFSHMPGRFLAQAAHFQTVSSLPPHAITLAKGTSGIQAARFDTNCWGVQFHPEFTKSDIDAIISTVALSHSNEIGARLFSNRMMLQETPDAATLLHRFLALSTLPVRPEHNH